jgi:cAMP-specific phosphodiesterase 4
MLGNFTSLEILSLCIAAAVHDIDHPGFNNNFLVQTQHPLALLYNDQSVLESHHLSRAFEISRMKGCEIFNGLAPDQYQQVREMIITMVMATGVRILTRYGATFSIH